MTRMIALPVQTPGRGARMRCLPLLGFLWSACFDPIYPEGIPCSDAGTCPPGQICDVGNICRSRPLSPPVSDASPEPDAIPEPDAAPTCSDGVRNGTETGIDCGGSCPPCSSVCGDGERTEPEECDEGAVTTATCDSDCTLPACNDGILNVAAGEEVEPPSSPSTSVPVDELSCRYDFSNIAQLFCNRICGRIWGGGDGCQQEDADVLCKLKTGNPNSTAVGFAVGTTSSAPGICCPPPADPDPSQVGCVELGVLDTRGVELPVFVHDTDLMTANGSGEVITDVQCTNP